MFWNKTPAATFSDQNTILVFPKGGVDPDKTVERVSLREVLDEGLPSLRAKT